MIPSAEARKLAAVLGKEPNLVQLILEESAEVVRAERGVLIVETRHGLVCANAGIDSSNVAERRVGAASAGGPRRLGAAAARGDRRRGRGADRRS